MVVSHDIFKYIDDNFKMHRDNIVLMHIRTIINKFVIYHEMVVLEHLDLTGMET